MMDDGYWVRGGLRGVVHLVSIERKSKDVQTYQQWTDVQKTNLATHGMVKPSNRQTVKK